MLNPKPMLRGHAPTRVRPALPPPVQCNSCWIFAAVAAMESAAAISTGKVQPLSQQQIMACAGTTCSNTG